MDLYTDLSTLSTEMNTFSCGNPAVKNEIVFCKNCITALPKIGNIKEKELKKLIINRKIY